MRSVLSFLLEYGQMFCATSTPSKNEITVVYRRETNEGGVGRVTFSEDAFSWALTMVRLVMCCDWIAIVSWYSRRVFFWLAISCSARASSSWSFCFSWSKRDWCVCLSLSRVRHSVIVVIVVSFCFSKYSGGASPM